MKTTTVKVGQIRIGLGAPAGDPRQIASDLARRVSSQIERRSGTQLPKGAAGQLAGRLARALAGPGSR